MSDSKVELSRWSLKYLDAIERIVSDGPCIPRCGICKNLVGCSDSEEFVEVISIGWRGQKFANQDPLARYIGGYHTGEGTQRWEGEAGCLRRELLAHLKTRVLAGDWDKYLVSRGRNLQLEEETNHDY